LICHSYEGLEPPFVGVAVNVAELPVQIEEEGVEIATEGATVAVTLIVIIFDVEGCAQEMLEVITQVTLSLLTSVEVVKVGAVSPPTFVPFTLH
jgi:hypothetical protein